MSNIKEVIGLDTAIRAITRSIEKHQCVILLGPNVARTEQGIPLQDDLVRYLREEADLEIDFDMENLAVINDPVVDEVFFPDALNEFYEKHKAPDKIHELLAEIPAHVFISITPDVKLREAFTNKDYPFEFRFYHKDSNAKEKPLSDHHKPIIYNLFGCFEEPDSIIKTTKDLYDFLFALLSGEKPLPRYLQSFLNDARLFVFLGFDFDKWYMKLLLVLFKLHTDKKVPIPLASGSGTNMEKKVRTFIFNNFKMQFADADSFDFVEQIHKKFEEQDLLRPQMLTRGTTADQKRSRGESVAVKLDTIKGMIGNDEVERAIEAILEMLQSGANKEMLEEYEHELIEYRARFKGFLKRTRLGHMNREDERREEAKIRQALLELISVMRKDLGA